MLIAANQSIAEMKRHKKVVKVVNEVIEEDKQILEAIDDGDTYESAAIKATKAKKAV